MGFYKYRRMAPPPMNPPKLKVPKLDENQLAVLSALFVINATEGFFHAEQWLLAFEEANGYETGSLAGFLDFFAADCYVN